LSNRLGRETERKRHYPAITVARRYIWGEDARWPKLTHNDHLDIVDLLKEECKLLCMLFDPAARQRLRGATPDEGKSGAGDDKAGAETHPDGRNTREEYCQLWVALGPSSIRHLAPEDILCGAPGMSENLSKN
jgi:hypothetical protein